MVAFLTLIPLVLLLSKCRFDLSRPEDRHFFDNTDMLCKQLHFFSVESN